LQTNDASSAYQILLLKDAGKMDAIIRKGIHGTPSDAAIISLTSAGS
jgi:hypothetical protein